MKSLIVSMVLVYLALPFLAHADDWICKEASSIRNGNTISSCGIGYGENEDKARHNALKASRNEFKEVCDLSSDCKNHAIVANPMRTTCEFKGKQYKCYRMVEFRIGEKMDSMTAQVESGHSEYYENMMAIQDESSEMWKREYAKMKKD